MEPSIKMEGRERRRMISLRCASFENAIEVAARNYAEPPRGYRLDGATILRRNHSGRRMMLRLEFLHIDRSFPPLREEELSEVFELDAKVAAGLGEYEGEGREAKVV